MSRNASDDGRPRRGRPADMARWLLRLQVPMTDLRIVDYIVIFVGIPVAVVVCMPILFVAIGAGAAVGVLLSTIGVPDQVAYLTVPLGLIGGLVLCFLAMVWIYRRLPLAVRSIVADDGMEGTPAATAPRQDQAADGSTLMATIAAIDQAFAPDQARLVDDGRSGDPTTVPDDH